MKPKRWDWMPRCEFIEGKGKAGMIWECDASSIGVVSRGRGWSTPAEIIPCCEGHIVSAIAKSGTGVGIVVLWGSLVNEEKQEALARRTRAQVELAALLQEQADSIAAGENRNHEKDDWLKTGIGQTIWEGTETMRKIVDVGKMMGV